MKNKSTIILAAVFIVLAIIYFMTTYRPPEVSSGAYPLFEDGMPMPDRVEMAASGQPEVVLTKRDGTWYMEEPFEFKADDRYVNNFLSQINEVMIDGVVSSREDMQSEYQVSDSTGVSLRVSGAGNVFLDYLIGKRSQDVGHTYARKRGAKDIELWRSMLSLDVRREPDQWRDRTVYTINSDDIIRVEAVAGDTLRTLAFADTTWIFTENGIEKPVDLTRARTVVAQIGGLVSDDFASASDIQRVVTEDYDVAVTFTVRNGDVHTFHLWRPAGSAVTCLLRKDEGDILYRLSGYKGSRIVLDYQNLEPMQ